QSAVAIVDWGAGRLVARRRLAAAVTVATGRSSAARLSPRDRAGWRAAAPGPTVGDCCRAKSPGHSRHAAGRNLGPDRAALDRGWPAAGDAERSHRRAAR